jgi:hypothetical protein
LSIGQRFAEYQRCRQSARRFARLEKAGDDSDALAPSCGRVRCRQCAAVKRERLDFLADNPFYTKRFAYYVGRRCRSSTIKDVAKELALDWHTVKELDKQYMRAQLAGAGTPAPQRIGIDELSLRKRHTYRIVVSDLDRQRATWFGGQDRSEASMSQFYAWLGEKKSRRVKLVVMDMWKPFRKATRTHAPQAAILFDKFHVMRHLGEALDQVRKTEYRRLSDNDRRFIKGQKYTLLSNRENLTLESRQALKALLRANRRLLLRPAVELRTRGLGATVLRELVRGTEVATLGAVQEVRRDDRASLGRHRGVLLPRQQSLARLRRGTEQQDSRDPATRLRPSRRGVPAPEDPHVHASAALKSRKSPTRVREDPKKNNK